MDLDNSSLQLLLRGDTKTLSTLYQESFPSIKQLILQNSGQIEDAEDVFQEALVVLYRKLKSNSLTLNCTISTYIYAICRNMWLDRLRRAGKEIGTLDGDQNIVAIGQDIVEIIYQNDRYLLYQKHFQEISEGCQKLLKLFLEGKSMRLITEKMGFSSESYTRKRKFNCKEKLIKKIKADPLYDELKQDNVLEIKTIN